MATLTGHPGLQGELQDYELLERIASGSMACVYKGRHRRTGAPVAICTASPAPTVASG